MIFRIRKSNLSLERTVYKPANKDVQGNTLIPALRTTEYIGSMSAHAKFADVPAKLLAQLDEREKVELREFLKKNETPQDYWLSNLPCQLGRCSQELKKCAALVDGPDARKALELNIKAAEKEWVAFYKTAQELGLKRRLNRTKKQHVETGQKAGSPPTDSRQLNSSK